jgi:hypothetical protein
VFYRRRGSRSMASERPDLSASPPAGASRRPSDHPLLKEGLALETAEDGVLKEPIKGQPCVFLPYLRQAEDAIAEAV